MITSLNIENFKSIQKLDIKPKRINLFIGKPGSGKSNILEAISLLSKKNVKHEDYIRMNDYSDLFFNRNIEKNIKVELDNESFEILFKNEDFQFICRDSEFKKLNKYLTVILRRTLDGKKNKRNFKDFQKNLEKINSDNKSTLNSESILIQNNLSNYSTSSLYFQKKIYFYKYKDLEFRNPNIEVLNAPFGENLVQIIATRGSLKKSVVAIFEEFNYKLIIDSSKNELKILKEENEGNFIPLPYSTLSDTVKRVIFYLTAMHTENSTLLFEEPESHIFPFYNKYLAERIAEYNTNQFFIATHNSAFISSIIQKANPDDLAIYICNYKNHETILDEIKKEKFSRILDLNEDLFLNLDRI